ncbi:MAG: 30S ribosomal protein S2 [Fibrobacter sp.]|nr:30S ribosomal protein S2 [Fibrobacter sp.]
MPLTVQDLLEAGTHFGHQTKRWNPKMKRFILCPKNGIYIIDLNKTLVSLDKFLERVKLEASRGGKVLFVGTKKQLKDSIREEAERCNMPYVTERWLGGMLTNFQTIRQSIAKLEKIEAMEADGTIEALPKKERLLLAKRKEKLLSVLDGIRKIRKLPSIIFVVDTIKEHIAISEGRKLRIPIGAVVDTNCDPDIVDYPIPGNDDAIKSVQLIARAVSDTILSVNKTITSEEMETAKEENVNESEQVDVSSDEEVVADEGGDEETNAKKRKVVRKKIVKYSEDD